jgi:hypothetical protein
MKGALLQLWLETFQSVYLGFCWSGDMLIFLTWSWELIWSTKDAAQPDRVEGLLTAPLTVTLWLMSHHGSQLRWKGHSENNPNHPVIIPCGKKLEYPEKTHDFRQGVDWLFSHKCQESTARIEPTISEVVNGAFSDHRSHIYLNSTKIKFIVDSYINSKLFSLRSNVTTGGNQSTKRKPAVYIGVYLFWLWWYLVLY